jgi:glycosyltransferase involved in cell wall biosynthesis
MRRNRQGTSASVLYLITDQISSVLLHGQLAYLRAHGFDVHVGTRVVEGRQLFDEGAVVHNVPFVREPSPMSDLRALLATLKLIRLIRPTIVNASTPKASLLGMIAAWSARVAVRVYVVRGLRFETAVGWRRRLFRRIEKTSMHLATHVVFNSISLRAMAEREGVIAPGRGRLFGSGSGNGIAIDRFVDIPEISEARRSLGVPVDAAVIGFVGRLTTDKGIGDLVVALTRELASRTNVVALIVGDFEDGDPVDAGIRRAILTDPRIVHVPWLDRPGLAYRAMHVLAFPSLREGLPNAPLEAQLCERPVVAYSATGTVDALVPDVTGVLVARGDVRSLGRELAELLDDPDRRRAMGAAGREWVSRTFDQRRLWEEVATSYRRWIAASERRGPHGRTTGS